METNNTPKGINSQRKKEIKLPLAKSLETRNHLGEDNIQRKKPNKIQSVVNNALVDGNHADDLVFSEVFKNVRQLKKFLAINKITNKEIVKIIVIWDEEKYE